MNLVWTVLGTLAAAYGALLAVLFLSQSSMVYYPEIGREIVATPSQAGLNYEPVNIASTDGVMLDGWFVPSPQPKGVILLLHGNAGNISHRIDWLTLFHKMGYSTLLFDYRGYGRSTGKPSERGTYDDAEAAWRHLVQDRHVPPGDIILVGESLGGAIAARLASRQPVRALVLVSVFTSVPDLGAEIYPYLPIRLLATIRYDTAAYLRNVRSPVLVAHSRDDDIVPISHGRALYEMAPEPKAFLEMRGGHNDAFPFMNAAWAQSLKKFLEQHERMPIPGNQTLTRPGE